MSSQRFTGLQMWNELVELIQQTQEWPLCKLAEALKARNEELREYLADVSRGDSSITFFSKGHQEWVKFNLEQMHFILPLNYEEWKALRELFQDIEADSPLSELKRNLVNNVPSFNNHEAVYSEAEVVSVMSLDSELIQALQLCVEEKRACYVQTAFKEIHLYPNRIIHLEGDLCLIAEDVVDHCLTAISLKEVQSHRHSTKKGGGRVSNFEVEEFITAIRSMNDQETRLILKIHDPDSVNLFPDYHFLGKPCMVKNPNGDLIWAAYVEPCSHLFEWLLSLGRRVEILDPVSFKQKYLDYCEEKIRNIA
ncbi:MAG TPA: WYL domain-containing protein [Bacteriovoracaceae bacterium]|nr:WYL domain-containing protein [Bacteriovoracaceae bacterium]